MNEDIRATQIRVIDDRGAQLGVMSPRDAIQIARERDADLVEIVPNANPPVCKVINFGKFKYELAKKDKIQKKHQHVSLLKEIRFHPNTDTHDFDFKVRHAINFLKEGHKVKATVVFKGREITYKEKGEDLLTRFSERVSEFSKVDQAPHMEGRSMIAIYAPERKKTPKSDDALRATTAAEKKKPDSKPEQAS